MPQYSEDIVVGTEQALQETAKLIAKGSELQRLTVNYKLWRSLYDFLYARGRSVTLKLPVIAARRKAVIYCISKSMTHKQIASLLEISESTVRNDIQIFYSNGKLVLKGKTQKV